MKKNNLIVYIVLLGCISIALGIADVYFYEQMNSIGARIHDLSQKNIQSAHSKEEIQKLQNSISFLKPQIDKVDTYFLPADGEVDFINNIETLARSLGLKIDIDSIGIDADKNIAGDGLQYLDVHLTVSGGWSGNYKFLYDIENLPYSVSVGQVDLLNLSSVSDATVKSRDVWQNKIDIKVLQKNK